MNMKVWLCILTPIGLAMLFLKFGQVKHFLAWAWGHARHIRLPHFGGGSGHGGGGHGGHGHEGVSWGVRFFRTGTMLAIIAILTYGFTVLVKWSESRPPIRPQGMFRHQITAPPTVANVIGQQWAQSRPSAQPQAQRPVAGGTVTAHPVQTGTVASQGTVAVGATVTVQPTIRDFTVNGNWVKASLPSGYYGMVEWRLLSTQSAPRAVTRPTSYGYNATGPIHRMPSGVVKPAAPIVRVFVRDSKGNVVLLREGAKMAISSGEMAFRAENGQVEVTLVPLLVPSQRASTPQSQQSQSASPMVDNQKLVTLVSLGDLTQLTWAEDSNGEETVVVSATLPLKAIYDPAVISADQSAKNLEKLVQAIKDGEFDKSTPPAILAKAMTQIEEDDNEFPLYNPREGELPQSKELQKRLANLKKFIQRDIVVEQVFTETKHYTSSGAFLPEGQQFSITYQGARISFKMRRSIFLERVWPGEKPAPIVVGARN